MSGRMTDQEIAAFLMIGTFTGKLASTRRNGSPHVAPIWFVTDGEELVFTTAEATIKGRNLRRDPRVAMSVDDQSPPYSFVMVRGTAALSRDLDDLLHWATLIGARYMGEDRAEEFGRRNAVRGELLVRVTPTHVVGMKEVAV